MPRQKECRPIRTNLARGRVMLFDIAGKNAPVAGASRGLGLGAVRGFAEAGANLALVSRQMPNAVMEERRDMASRRRFILLAFRARPQSPSWRTASLASGANRRKDSCLKMGKA